MSETAEAFTPTSRARFAVGAVLSRGVVPLYVLAGAFFKFISAEPEKLPQWIQNVVFQYTTTGGAGLDYETALLGLLKAFICLEIIAAGVVILIPRLSRLAASLILATFIFVLIAEVNFRMRQPEFGFMDAAFSGSCGCFGSALPIPPGVMLLIDAGLLALVLLFPLRTRPIADMPTWALAAMLVWIIGGITLGMNPIEPEYEGGGDWKLRQPIYWEGRNYYETFLAQHLDVDPSWFGGGEQTWIIYRETCPVCHNLFEQEYADDLPDRTVIAIRMPIEPDAVLLEEPEEVVCPDCQFVDWPQDVDWAVSTPTIIRIDENGVITDVRDPRIEEFGKQSEEI